MITITQTSESADNGIIVIGRQGEHDVRQVQFDLSYLAENFGDGVATLVHKRTDDAPYFVTATQEDGVLTWVVSATDTALEGFGRCEIRWTVDDALAKTVVYKTRVLKSITADTEIPSAYQSWYDQLVDYVDQVKVSSDEELAEAIEAAEGYAEAAQQAAAQAGYMTFEVRDNGHLYMERTEGIDVTFVLDSTDGHLYVEDISS